uniref:Uncharacterized protein n=1 Tax=Oryctolagus cuniculus TaxID=9986 RepID=A0A5F9C610_RABIT
MAAASPWGLAPEPGVAGPLWSHFVASGIAAEEILSVPKGTDPCFVDFSELRQITNTQAEIHQKNLEIKLPKLEKDKADVVHPFLCLQCWHPIWVPVQALAAPLPIQLSAMAWESSNRWPESLGSCTPVGFRSAQLPLLRPYGE